MTSKKKTCANCDREKSVQSFPSPEADNCSLCVRDAGVPAVNETGQATGAESTPPATDNSPDDTAHAREEAIVEKSESTVPPEEARPSEQDARADTLRNTPTDPEQSIPAPVPPGVDTPTNPHDAIEPPPDADKAPADAAERRRAKFEAGEY